MELKAHNQLSEAIEHFYAWRLLEAYTIFRRYFDRIPFKPEKDHARYIGMFVRTLAELGKEHELKFYMGELERHYEIARDPWIGFTLGVVYYHLSEPRLETARGLFEQVTKTPAAAELHARAKMFLANYHDRVTGDVSAMRRLIDSIEPCDDPTLRPLVAIWRAKVLRDEKRFAEAESAYLAVLNTLDPKKDWYPYFSAKLGVAILYLKQNDMERATSIVNEVKALFEGRHFKSIQLQLKALESQLSQKGGMTALTIDSGGRESQVTYANRRLTLKRESPSEKLLLLLAAKRFLDKPSIVKGLYDRQYNGEQDDKLIYYHVHMLRKRLREIGVPNDAIFSEESGYRLVPAVEKIDEKN